MDRPVCMRSMLTLLRPAAQTSGDCSDQSAPPEQDGDWAAAASTSGRSASTLSCGSLAPSGNTISTQASGTAGKDKAGNNCISSASSVRS
jgi:hypothetical protein